jgi:fermentation-respiration switch protein FrsA (DUF1100 family)
MLPAVGPPGALAAMTTPDAEPGFRAIDPPGSSWRNEAAARVMLTVGLYRPGRRTAAIRCPVLVCVAEQDAITPPAPAIAAAERAPRGELRRYPGGHFDLYRGEAFERVVADETDFLTRHLLPAEAG